MRRSEKLSTCERHKAAERMAITGLLTPGQVLFPLAVAKGKAYNLDREWKGVAGLHGEQRGQRLGRWEKPRGHCHWAEPATREEWVGWTPGSFRGTRRPSASPILHVQEACTRPRASPPDARRGRDPRGGPRARVSPPAPRPAAHAAATGGHAPDSWSPRVHLQAPRPLGGAFSAVPRPHPPGSLALARGPLQFQARWGEGGPEEDRRQRTGPGGQEN